MYEMLNLKKAFETDEKEKRPKHDKIPEFDEISIDPTIKSNLNILYKK